MLPGGGNESQLLRENAECTSIATGGRRAYYGSTLFLQGYGKIPEFWRKE